MIKIFSLSFTETNKHDAVIDFCMVVLQNEIVANLSSLQVKKRSHSTARDILYVWNFSSCCLFYAIDRSVIIPLILYLENRWLVGVGWGHFV